MSLPQLLILLLRQPVQVVVVGVAIFIKHRSIHQRSVSLTSQRAVIIKPLIQHVHLGIYLRHLLLRDDTLLLPAGSERKPDGKRQNNKICRKPLHRRLSQRRAVLVLERRQQFLHDSLNISISEGLVKILKYKAQRILLLALRNLVALVDIK